MEIQDSKNRLVQAESLPMYKIIGVDSREYGPLSAEQVRRWIEEGRLNSQTQIQPEGATNWVPLSTLPEFATVLVGESTAPPGNAPLPLNAELLTQEILSRPVNLEVTNCLSRAWDLFVADFWIFVGINALSWLMLSAASSAAVGLLLNGPILGGLCWYFLKRIRGEAATLTEAFAGFTGPFVHLMLVSLVAGLLVIVGLILCIVPGIYLSVAWMFALPLVVDKRLGFWDAMELSRKVANRHFGPLLGLFLLSALINLAGVLAFGVGVFLTMPLTVIAWLYAYHDLFAPVPAPGPVASSQSSIPTHG